MNIVLQDVQPNPSNLEINHDMPHQDRKPPKESDKKKKDLQSS